MRTSRTHGIVLLPARCQSRGGEVAAQDFNLGRHIYLYSNRTSASVTTIDDHCEMMETLIFYR